MTRELRRAVVFLAVVLAGCLVPDVNLDGKACSASDPCADNYQCIQGQCLLPGEAPDGGPVDAGSVAPVDAGPVDAGPLDAGPVDAGPADAGVLISDDFTRPGDGGSIAPWTLESGVWKVSAGMVKATSGPMTYGYIYQAQSSWGDVLVTAHVSFLSETDPVGGGVGARLNTASGAHYAAWIYPLGEFDMDNHPQVGIVRFDSWTSLTTLQLTNLSSLASGPHELQLKIVGNQLSLILDGVQQGQVVDATDGGVLPPGGVDLEMWTDETAFTYAVDDVQVTAAQ